MAVFTQSAPDHHVVVVADESEVFGPYVPFHTWTPAPVAGTDGLQPDELVAGARPMGRDPDAEPLRRRAIAG